MTGQHPSDREPDGSADYLDGGTFTIRNPETLKVAADPLRRRIWELVREEPRTTKEVAAALQVSQTRLYYHIKLLEERGLIAVAETRLVSGIVEKRYRTTAYRLTIDKALIGSTSEGSDALDAYISVVLDQVRTEINRSVDAGLIDVDRTREDELMPRRLVLGRKWLRLTPEQLEDFSRRYSELMDTFEVASGEADVDEVARLDGNSQYYEWLIGFYPTLSPDHAEPGQAQQE